LEGKAKIYGLYDPDDSNETVMYVGRSIRPIKMRLGQHIHKASRNKESDCLRIVWIRSILDRGFQPRIKELEEVDIDDAKGAEGRWIDHFNALGNPLVNVGSPNQGQLFGATQMVWTPEQIALLGQHSDSDLAEKFGVSRKTVEYKRNLLEIERKPQTNFVIPPMGGWNKKVLPQELIDQLGTMPDKQLGTLFGMSKMPVMNERQARGIPSYAEQNGNQTRFRHGVPKSPRGRGKVIALPRKRRKSSLPSGVTQMRMIL
jgi:hypothetical protein